MKRLLILYVLLILLMGGSYIALRVESIAWWLTLTLTITMITFGPMLIYLLYLRPRQLPKLWVYVSFLLSLGAAYLIIPKSQSTYLNKILVWMLPVIEISVVLIVVFGIIHSVRKYRSIQSSEEEQNFLEIVKIALAPRLGNGFVLNAVLTELNVFYYSIIIWFTKPKVRSEGSYTYHKQSQIRTISIVLAILIVVEGIALHAALQMWSSIAAWILTVLNIYALLYIIALYNSIRFLPYIVDKDRFIIRLGFQSSISIGINNIERIEKAVEKGIGDKIPKDTYYSLLAIDSPQYELKLKESEIMYGAYGRKTKVNSVVFRVDEPQKFLDAIK